VQAPNIEIVILEYWDVEEENLDKFMEWFEKYYYGALTHTPAYAGQLITVQRPNAHEECFGHPESGQVITFHPLISQMGTRTDASVNFDVMLRNEYNVLCMQFMTDATKLSTLFPDYMVGFEKIRPNWKEEHPDLDNPADVVAREYFSLIKNHWDVFLDVRRTQWNEGPLEPMSGPSWLAQGVGA
jgi:hypothetical protein